MNQYEVRLLPGTNGASAPFFAPDGQSVGFFADGKLKVVSLQGGEPRPICDADLNPTGTWGDDDMIYFTPGRGLSRVSAAGGDAEFLGADSGPTGGGYPQILPGGEAVLISSRDGAVHVSLETRETRILIRDVLFARYAPTGHLVYVRAGTIEAVPFSLDTFRETGPRIPVLEGVLSDSVSGSAQFAFANNGLLVYVPGDDTGRSIPAWVDRQGQVEPLAMRARMYGTPRLSPDGNELAILVREFQSSVYVYNIATGMETRLTREGNSMTPVVWTPDGKRVVFSLRKEEEEGSNLLWAPANGSGRAAPLYPDRQGLVPCLGYPNGKRLLVRSGDLGIYVLSVDEPRGLEPVFTLGFPAFQFALSPDGKYIAYASNKGGDFHVYVCRYPQWDQEKRVSLEFGEEPIWSNDGDELFYRNRNKWMVVSVSTEPEFKAGQARVVFEGAYINVAGFSYDVAPDGQRFLVLLPQYDDSHGRELRVVTNWFEELKRRVPSPEAL